MGLGEKISGVKIVNRRSCERSRGIMNSELRVMNWAAARAVRRLEFVIAGTCEGNVDCKGNEKFCARFVEFAATFWDFRHLGFSFFIDGPPEEGTTERARRGREETGR